jgi:GNAT superfamily N-acetyltransferase
VERWASPYLAAQAAYLRHLATAPVAEIVERGGVYAVRTGIASNAENGVLSGDVPVTDKLASETIGWLNERGLAASWLCAEGDAREKTAGVLADVGCRPDNESWEMRAVIPQLVLDGFAPSAGISIVAVSSGRELDAWLGVAGVCGWFETTAERRAWKELHLGLGHAASARSRLYVAFRGDRPVGMAAAFFADEIVLLSAVGVLDDEQRRGIGRALALIRLREARERGCAIAVLAPSRDGAKLYASLGFETHRQPSSRWFYLPTPTPSPSGSQSEQG